MLIQIPQALVRQRVFRFGSLEQKLPRRGIVELHPFARRISRANGGHRLNVPLFRRTLEPAERRALVLRHAQTAIVKHSCLIHIVAVAGLCPGEHLFEPLRFAGVDAVADQAGHERNEDWLQRREGLEELHIPA